MSLDNLYNRFTEQPGRVDPANASIQAIELTPDKKPSGLCVLGRHPPTSARPRPCKFCPSLNPREILRRYRTSLPHRFFRALV
jgi:hypothetical protein